MTNCTEVTLNLSSNVTGDSDDRTNFPLKLLLTDTQVSKLCKDFANNLLANIKLSKTQLSKMVQLGEFISEVIKFAIDPFKSINKKLYENKEFVVPAIHLARKI